VREAALQLPGVRLMSELRQSGQRPHSMPPVRHSTCAVVGNGHGVTHAAYGPYIDAHEVSERTAWLIALTLCATEGSR
jgi:hypothetical protein